MDYYDSWDEESEMKLKEALCAAKSPFMLSAWDYNQYRKNEYIESVWNFCEKINKEHFYHLGAKEKNRVPMVEALLINYKQEEAENKLYEKYEQLCINF